MITKLRELIFLILEGKAALTFGLYLERLEGFGTHSDCSAAIREIYLEGIVAGIRAPALDAEGVRRSKVVVVVVVVHSVNIFFLSSSVSILNRVQQ